MNDNMGNLEDYLDKFATTTLRFLSRQPTKSYYQRELSGKLRISIGKTNQVLRLLEREGIISRERKGKIDLYKYNIENPVARQLKVLFTLAELNDLVRSLKRASKKTVLYGSCATGEDTSESDIDLLITTNDKERARRIISSAKSKPNRKISALILTPTEFSALKTRDPPLHEQIGNGIVLWREE